MPKFGPSAQVNIASHLLKDFIKAATEIDGPSNAIRIETCGDGAPMRVNFTVPHVMGVIMPYRWTGHTGVPFFLPQPEPEAEKVAAE